MDCATGVTYVLFFLTSVQPFPTVQMIREFPTREECVSFVQTQLPTAPPEVKARMSCQGVVIKDIGEPIPEPGLKGDPKKSTDSQDADKARFERLKSGELGHEGDEAYYDQR